MRQRSEYEAREWRLIRAYATGELPGRWVAWLWWTWGRQATTWRWN